MAQKGQPAKPAPKPGAKKYDESIVSVIARNDKRRNSENGKQGTAREART